MKHPVPLLAGLALIALAAPSLARADDAPDRKTRSEKAANAVDVAGQAAGKAAEAAANLFYSLPLASQAADQRAARAAVARRESLPLDVILAKLAATHPGDVVDVDFEKKKDRWIYEIKLIDPGGHVMEVEVAAADGAIISSRRDRF